MSIFRSFIRYIQSNDPVSPEIINTPLQQLQSSIRYLKEIIDLENLGQQLILYDQPLDPATSENDIVYFDRDSLNFKQAKPEASTVNGTIQPANTAIPVGLILRKTSPQMGDLLVWGIAEINLVDALQNGETPQECVVYYLSNREPGKLTATAPPIPIIIGTSLKKVSNTRYLFNFTPNIFTAYFAHQHLSFELKCELATDSSEEGWLPVTDNIFVGKAPASAKYGYNISQSPFKNYWPPSPIENAFLLWYTGEDTNPLLCGIPHGNNNDYVIIDKNGIWWLTDCGREPWNLGSDTLQTGNPCPIARRRLILYFSIPIANTNANVASLRTNDTTGLTLLSLETRSPATTGHLILDIDKNYFTQNQDDNLSQVIKYNSEENKLVTGKIVSSITSESSALIIKEDNTVLATGNAGRGNLKISLNTTQMIGDLPTQVIRLMNVVEGSQGAFIYLAFLSNRTSDIIGRINIPYRADFPGLLQVKLRFWITGTSPGNPSQALSLSATNISPPSTSIPITINPVLTPINWTTTSQNISFSQAGEHIILESQPIPTTPGSIILFKLTRQQTDSYNGDIFLIQESARPV